MCVCTFAGQDGLEIERNTGNCTSGGTIIPPPPPPPTPPTPAPPPAPAGALNVLLVLIDDLRPELGLYGSHVPTPKLDSWARGDGVTVFSNAYTQYSFCCPSRNSFVSGRRPSKTKAWNFLDDFRHAPAVAAGPTADLQGGGQNWTTMPEWFKLNGWFTHALGKIFHPGHPVGFDPPSWSDPDRVADGAGRTPSLPAVVDPDGALLVAAVAPQDAEEADFAGAMAAGGCITGEPGGSYCEVNGTVGPDDQLAANGVVSLRMLANWSAAAAAKGERRPFFLGIGFHKPHIPWTIPTRFFSPLASIEDTALPSHPGPPKGMPPIAWNKGLGTHALDSYKDANLQPLHAFSNGSFVAFQPALTRAMRRGYYAAVSYTDHNIGRVLDELEASPAARNTVVVIMGDHGYSLGELNLWCKMNVFESGTRVPLLVRTPPSFSASKAAAHTTALAEAVDLYPTLVEVAGGTPPSGGKLQLEVGQHQQQQQQQQRTQKAPAWCDGDSLAAVLLDPSVTVKQAAYSEFVKCYSCCRVPDAAPCLPGGTQGRCAPPDAAGLADLHEMGDCFQVAGC